MKDNSSFTYLHPDILTSFPLGPVMIDLEGKELTQLDTELLQHPNVGGIILFTRNYESPEQLQHLTQGIRKQNSALLISVDQEGGRVQRFREGFTRLPPLAEFGEIYQKDKIRAKALAKEAAVIMATELIKVGIDFSFAPVLDVDQGVSKIIGDRSFGNNAQMVTELADAYISGMHAAGMVAVGKHFPGHGAVAADSHTELPIDNRQLATIQQLDLLPYRQLKDKLAGVMAAHIIYSEVDKNPAGFSHYWLKEVLRKQLNFNGAIFSDDLSMAGANFAGDYLARARLALAAGCDMVLTCNNRAGAIQVLDNLPQEYSLARQTKLQAMYFRR